MIGDLQPTESVSYMRPGGLHLTLVGRGVLVLQVHVAGELHLVAHSNWYHDEAIRSRRRTESRIARSIGSVQKSRRDFRLITRPDPSGPMTETSVLFPMRGGDRNDQPPNLASVAAVR